MDYFDDTVNRCVISAIENERHPLGVWSSGEKLLVALVLWDQAYLDAENYTYGEAMDRTASGIRLNRDDLPGWIDRVRVEVEAELDARGYAEVQ